MHDAPGSFGGGGYYAYDEPTLARAALHGCLDEDVNTGDPLVCRGCAYPPGEWDDPDPDDPPATKGEDPMWGRVTHRPERGSRERAHRRH